MNEPLNPHYDLAILGSGYAGSILAMIARRFGRSVLLLEHGQHPRVVIGESSTPLSNLLLEDLAHHYNLPFLLPLTTYGPWQRTHPDLACGLKRGFNFFAHDLTRPATDLAQPAPAVATGRLLVAASPHNEIADTHWYRAHTDLFLVQQAQALGVHYLDHAHLETATETPTGMRLEGHRHGHPISVHASLVLDATGPRGFLHRALHLGEAALPNYPHTRALYSHFSGVSPLSQTFAPPVMDVINGAPYPIDAAAVHHLFDGGWIWVLQFNNGITSAGVAATAARADELGLAEGEPAWSRLLARIPALRQQFAAARPVQPFTYLPQLPFRSATVSGDHWALLPSAAGFVDPLLSTGFALNLLGVTRLAKILEQSSNNPEQSSNNPAQSSKTPAQSSTVQAQSSNIADLHWGAANLPAQLATYAQQTDDDLLATARLIAALYRTLGSFPAFRALSLLYFAAASYAETVRRLRKPHLAPGFLLGNHPTFGPEARTLLERLAPTGQTRGLTTIPHASEITAEVLRIIAPIDVAGLSKTPPDAFYPVDAHDLLEARSKVEATHEQILDILNRAGFSTPHTT